MGVIDYEQYINKILKAESYFLGEKRLYRFTYPLNCVSDLEGNDLLINTGIVESIEKEIRQMFFIYYKIFSVYNVFQQNEELYRDMVKSEVEYFFIRYRIIYDIMDKHLTKAVDINAKDVPISIFNNDEFKCLKDIRNKIEHESTRTHIFIGKKVGKISFQIYDVGTLNNNIEMDEIFLDPEGSEIYDLKFYMIWMIIIMMTFLEEYFVEIKNIRLGGKSIPKEIEKQIKYVEEFYSGNLSSISFFQGDYEIVKEGIIEFKNHIEKQYNRIYI